MKRKIYYGFNYELGRTMYGAVVGEMNDGTKIYNECNEYGEIIDNKRQYMRFLKYGTQCFLYV